MKRLISIEFQKLWLNRASRVLILSYFIILSFIALIASIKLDIFGMEFKIADQGIFNFPYIWHFNTYIAVYLKAFLAIVIVSMMANEYTYGTLKQNLIDGLSKKEFIQSKFLTVLIFALSSTVFVFIMTLLLGYSFSSFTETSIVFTDVFYIGAFFIDLLAFFTFCLFAGILIKRSAFAIGFIILWYIGEWIIYAVLANKVFHNVTTTDKVTSFFPMISVSNLIVEPISRFKAYKAIENQMNATAVIPKDYSVHWDTVAIVLVWTAVFMYMSYRILKKRDL